MRARLDHVAINVRDTEIMMDFYTRVLQLEALRWQEYRDGEVLFPSVRLCENSILDFFPPALWHNDFELEEHTRHSRMNHLCLSVDVQEHDACVHRLEAEGIEIIIGPAKRWGAHGSGISVYVLDPEGNMVEIRKYGAGNEAEPATMS